MNTACNCLSLRQATRRVTQLYNQALAPLDLRATQFALLSAIERRGPIALNPLAEEMVLVTQDGIERMHAMPRGFVSLAPL